MTGLIREFVSFSLGFSGSLKSPETLLGAATLIRTGHQVLFVVEKSGGSVLLDGIISAVVLLKSISV